MPTWNIRYRPRTSGDKLTQQEDIRLLQADPHLVSITVNRLHPNNEVAVRADFAEDPVNPMVRHILQKGERQRNTKTLESALSGDPSDQVDALRYGIGWLATEPSPSKVTVEEIQKAIRMIYPQSTRKSNLPGIDTHRYPTQAVYTRDLEDSTEYLRGERVLESGRGLAEQLRTTLRNTSHLQREASDDGIAGLQREVDRDIFAIWDAEILGQFSESPAMPPSVPQQPWTASEEEGVMVINPRALEVLQGRRLSMEAFPLEANPTIRLSDIRERRFGALIDRPPPPPPGPDSVQVMIYRGRFRKILGDIID